jgi:hypothetical protein
MKIRKNKYSLSLFFFVIYRGHIMATILVGNEGPEIEQSDLTTLISRAVEIDNETKIGLYVQVCKDSFGKIYVHIAKENDGHAIHYVESGDYRVLMPQHVDF